MSTEFLSYTRETRRSTLFFAGLVLLAWALLAAWKGSPYAGLLGHEALEDHSISFAGHLGAFLLSWLLMTLAMMLPGSLPMLLDFIEPAEQRSAEARRASRRAVLVLAGYLLPWLLVGFLLYLGDSQLHRLAEPPGPLAQVSQLIPPAILLLAGLYQLSPLKGRALTLCRPVSHSKNLPSTWQPPESGSAFAQGLYVGKICIASCASLMLLMFALGHHRLELMLLLSGILAVERLTAWGARLAWGIGAALVAGSVIWIFVA